MVARLVKKLASEKDSATTARAVMVLGTSSHVGKSLLTAALCRIFHLRGFRVAPFKSQNMSLNSAATVEGLEIGRAQALQAEACEAPPSVHMNPILIKPTGDCASQIVVRGKIWGKLSAADYHQHRVLDLLPLVEESYAILSAQNDIVVLEGAGSPAEINLKENDIVNMRMAKLSKASCILVGDIDRGGVFASLYGTLALLDEDERQLIKGFVINKFRGDLQLLLPGIQMIEDRLGIPCLGVIPYLAGLQLEEEDSVALQEYPSSPWTLDRGTDRRLRIGVLQFPSLSNFTDFDSLRAEPGVHLSYCKTAEALAEADVILLPGSKQTVADLQWLRAKGFEDSIQEHVRAGGIVVGICGGMQMLGREIVDAEDVETKGSFPGLDLLPIRTTMQTEKITSTAEGILFEPSLFGEAMSCVSFQGYEIHVGDTEYLEGAKPFARIERASARGKQLLDGCACQTKRVFGSYLHGVFDNDNFRHEFLRVVRKIRDLNPPAKLWNRSVERARTWSRLTSTVEQALDLDRILSWIGKAQVCSRKP